MKYLMYFVFAGLLLASCNTSPSETAKTEAAPVKKEAVTPKPAAADGGVNWLSLEDAQKMTKKAPKKMIVDVYTYWCGPCKMMDRMTFKDPKVMEMMENNFYAVKFNAESPDPVKFNGEEYKNPNFRKDVPKNRRNSAHQLVSKLGIRGYPTLVVIDENMKIVKNIVGFKQPAQLLQELSAL